MATRGEAKMNEAKKKIVVIGSGNFGTAIGRHVATNVLKKKELKGYQKQVDMWTLEETLKDGRKLTDVINTDHVNVKYLPGVPLPKNLKAVPGLAEAVKDATVIVMVPPHQFVRRLSVQIAEMLTPAQKKNLIVVCLAKGIEFDPKKKVLRRMSEVFSECTGLPMKQCAALSGANIANELAHDYFAETTIAAQTSAVRDELHSIFHTENFVVELSDDAVGVELGGALKNVVAIAAGLIDGMKFGNNTKAAIIRLGLMEMMKFGSYKQLGQVAKVETFLGSAGVGDLLTTCYGGRNRLFGEALGKLWANDPEKAKVASVEALEKELLGGQKIQGVHTAEEVYTVLKSFKLEKEFPVFLSVYDVCIKKKDPRKVYRKIENKMDEVIDLKALALGELLDYARGQAERFGLKAQSRVTLKKALARGDKALLKTAFTRIIGKAARHSKKGSTLTISLKEEKGMFCMLVRNEGKGISERDMESVAKKMGSTASAVERIGGELFVASKGGFVEMGALLPKA